MQPIRRMLTYTYVQFHEWLPFATYVVCYTLALAYTIYCIGNLDSRNVIKYEIAHTNYITKMNRYECSIAHFKSASTIDIYLQFLPNGCLQYICGLCHNSNH